MVPSGRMIFISLSFPWSKNISPSIIHEIFLTKFFLPRFLLSSFPFCSKTTKTIFWESWNKRLFAFPISLSLSFSPCRCRRDPSFHLPSLRRLWPSLLAFIISFIIRSFWVWMPVPTSLWVPAFLSSLLSARSLSVHYNLVLFSLLFSWMMLPRSLDNQKKPFWLFSRFPFLKNKNRVVY